VPRESRASADLQRTAVQVAYRRLAITILGLDVRTLTAELREARLAIELERCEDAPLSQAA